MGSNISVLSRCNSESRLGSSTPSVDSQDRLGVLVAFFGRKYCSLLGDLSDEIYVGWRRYRRSIDDDWAGEMFERKM